LASASDDSSVKLWEASGKDAGTFKEHTDGVTSVAYSADGMRLASASHDATVRLWEVAEGYQTKLTLKGHTLAVWSVAWSADGTRLATASEDQSVKVWDARSGEEVLTLLHTNPVWSVVFSPDGTRLASASGNAVDTNAPGEIKLWDASSGKEILSLKKQTGPVWSVAFNPDGTRLASAGQDGTVRVWALSGLGESTATNAGWIELSRPGSGLAEWDELESLPDPQNANLFPTHRPTTGQWMEVGGVLRCVKQAPGWLRSKREFQDFVLELEFKLPTTRNGNSGIHIRSPATGHTSTVGMEVQILDDSKVRPSEITGSIHNAAAAAVSASKPIGEWNSMRIECRGDDISVWVNDRQVVQTNMQTNPELRTRPRKGFIGLSNWKGEALGCEFRNIRIKELAVAAVPPAATTTSTPTNSAPPATAVRAPSPVRQLEPEYAWLFDGTNLNAFTAPSGIRIGANENKVKDRILEMNLGALMTKRQYRFLELRLDFRAPADTACTIVTNFVNQCSIHDGQVEYTLLQPARGSIKSFNGSVVYRPGEWNSLIIRSAPSTLRNATFYPETKVNDATIPFQGQGNFKVLQAAPVLITSDRGSVEISNIRIKVLQ
jgi:WD40 repeat protein